MLPAEGYVTTDDGLRLWFQTVGSGPQVVVLPNGFHLLEDFSCLAPGRTLVFHDVRNRGRSDTVTDPAKLARGIHNANPRATAAVSAKLSEPAGSSAATASSRSRYEIA